MSVYIIGHSRDSRPGLLGAVHCHANYIGDRILPLDRDAGSNVGGRGISQRETVPWNQSHFLNRLTEGQNLP